MNNSENWVDVRCSQCHKLLLLYDANSRGSVLMKCPRCRAEVEILFEKENVRLVLLK